MLQGKHIILGISGGIAAYKSVFLLRLLIKAGAEVQVVITPNGKEFITPVTLSALSGKPVIGEFFTANTGEWHSHVDLGLWADAMIIAPATASSIAKMANGVADNMLITTYLSAKSQVFVAPAMDMDMFAHPSTQANLQKLREYGNIIIEPDSGHLASNLVGKGRMREPEEIIKIMQDWFEQQDKSNASLQWLRNKNVVITAGPTHEPMDPVRYIGNNSTGKMGFALADVAAAAGAHVTVVAGPVTKIPVNPNVKVVNVTTALQMLDATKQVAENADVCVFAAAVADYRPEKYHTEKIKRENIDTVTVALVRNPDIAKTISSRRKPGQIMVGFALETQNEKEYALSKLKAKGLDVIVMNSLRDDGAGFGVDTNKVTVYLAGGSEFQLPLMSKQKVAENILSIISECNL